MEVRTTHRDLALQHRFWAHVHSSIAYALALLMAAALIMHLYPLELLAGHGAFFEGGDAATNVAGWLFFRQDTWHFPMLKTDWLSYPEGTSVVFTDSIPLLVLPLKLIAGVLPANFHYFGLWNAASHLLQTTGAVLLIPSLGVRHLPDSMLTTAFALCWLALTLRFGHDVFLEHRRRYDLPQIEQVARWAGLEGTLGTYYFGAVFPIAVATRLAGRLRGQDQQQPRSQLKTHHPLVNAVLATLSSLELPMRRYNRLAGLTAFCLARKP